MQGSGEWEGASGKVVAKQWAKERIPTNVDW